MQALVKISKWVLSLLSGKYRICNVEFIPTLLLKAVLFSRRQIPPFPVSVNYKGLFSRYQTIDFSILIV